MRDIFFTSREMYVSFLEIFVSFWPTILSFCGYSMVMLSWGEISHQKEYLQIRDSKSGLKEENSTKCSNAIEVEPRVQLLLRF